MKLLDWLGRVVMLVLAGLVTLSIIGSIAAIPSGTIAPRIGFEPQPVPAETEGIPEPPINGIQPKSRTDRTGDRSEVMTTTAAPAQPEPIDPARWLEAITYALLALVGLGALACLLLWRGLRRIADEVARPRP